MYVKPTIRIGKCNSYCSSYQKKSHGNRYDQLLKMPAEEKLDDGKRLKKYPPSKQKRSQLPVRLIEKE